jgi:hypothetical protein
MRVRPCCSLLLNEIIFMKIYSYLISQSVILRRQITSKT